MESDGPPGQGTALGRWWGQPPQSSPSTDVMNQLCRVCGEPAAGFHFGAFTCEGCKSFFGRTYNNIGSITECKNNGECIINKKNRTACKACRLRKCLLVGMSKSGSRYGRRSNWFKIHCLLQEQQQAVGSGSSHLKEKSALALWGENYKNITIPPHFDSDSKGSPTSEENINNNTSSKDRERSPNSIITPNPYSAEAAAALWAARNSFMPMQLPPHHLPLPFLATPFASFPPPHPQRNFLLPFMQNLHSPTQNATLTISSSPSRSSPGTSETSQTSSPVRNHRNHQPSPSLDNKNHVVKDEPDEDEDVRLRLTRNDKTNEESSLAMLRSLGPVQDFPIDLSVKPDQVNVRTDRRTEGDVSDSDEDCCGDKNIVDSDRESDCSEKNDENFNKRKRPLDLTKTSHIEV